jgi:hypothetical protein
MMSAIQLAILISDMMTASSLVSYVRHRALCDVLSIHVYI